MTADDTLNDENLFSWFQFGMRDVYSFLKKSRIRFCTQDASLKCCVTLQSNGRRPFRPVSQMANGGPLRPVMSPCLKSPPWSMQ